jgi:hypothetical protein
MSLLSTRSVGFVLTSFGDMRSEEYEVNRSLGIVRVEGYEFTMWNTSRLHFPFSEVKLGVELDKVWQKLTLRFPKKVGAQKAQLTLKFESVLNDKMHGFYRSTYKDAAGNEKFLFSTQFEVRSNSLLNKHALQHSYH